MYPYVFKTEFYSLGWENVMIILGIAAGVWLAFRRAAHKGDAYQNMILELSTWLTIAGIAGARAWEMIWTWEEYNATPWERFAIWNGGMSIQGSVIAGLIVALIFAWRRKVRVWELLDILAPGVLLGQGIGRIGCLLSGDSFGRPLSEVPWVPEWLGLIYHPDSPAYQIMGPIKLVPAEAAEMVLDFVILAFLLLYKPKREVSGRIVLLYGALYSAARFALEFLRADSLLFSGLKVAQLLALASVLATTLLLVGRYQRQSATTSHTA